MKKKILIFMLCLFAFPCVALFSSCDANKDAKEAVKDDFKGEKRSQDIQGIQGESGREVEFQETETEIQWYYC